MAKVTYQEIRSIQDTITTTGYAANYVLGAYEVLLAQIVADLPAYKQKEAILSLESLKKRVDTNYSTTV